MQRITAGVLDVAYLEYGPQDGPPVILLHGFPYDVHAYDVVAPLLGAAGKRVIVPWLRGYGPTRFLSAHTPRSGEQAVLGMDLLTLLDALAIPQAVVAGYDWGGRAACIVAALWPERVAGLVSCGGYNIQDIAQAGTPQPAEAEYRLWYQYYLHSERGRAGLTQDRDGFCRLLWRLWSPTWQFDDATFARSAEAFANPDFVDVVVQSYRHRFGLAAGDPVALATEARLAAQPTIGVPTVVLHGDVDGVSSASQSAAKRDRFTGPYTRHVLPGIGHNPPQEAPQAFVAAVLEVAAAG
jgi:pimeloyl-ACP methyl ester carboxylesterase